MKNICTKVIWVLSICLGFSSCSDDEDNRNSFFLNEPDVEILSFSFEGMRDCYFSCKIWPTEEMYQHHMTFYECGLEYSTDSQFRTSTRISFGPPYYEDFIINGHVGDLLPDSTYYVRPLLIQSFNNPISHYDRSGNKILSESANVIVKGKIVSFKVPSFNVEDFFHVSIKETGPMNLVIDVECESQKMVNFYISDNEYSLELSDDESFTDNVQTFTYKTYSSENRIELRSLKPSCNYYLRVRVPLDPGGVEYYGKEIKATTAALEKVNGMQYVDLGLSVMWATCNVGASSPYEAGGYYCWGELEERTIEGQKVEDIDFMNTIFQYSKYNESDGLLVLRPEDDIATVKWGAPWRMPDKNDIVELHENCDRKTLEIDGMTVIQYTSRINGNYIFVPAAGWYGGGEYLDWKEAFLWTRTLDDVFSPDIAFSLRSVVWDLVDRSTRSNCLNVRPVYKPNN